ncbi:MAG TPA: SDR family oxidoreductase [Planktothrix sp.]|jgi:NADP-dependent 3-hydroxy acid dehydrogenase YdfG
MKLKDKVAVITGASSGIGEAIAHALAVEGAEIALLARRQDKLKEVCHDVTLRSGREPLMIVTDVSDQKSVTKAIEKVEKKFQRIDILVNNAGVMYLGSVAEAKPEEWRTMVDINLMGLMYCTQAVLPIMKKHGAGDIVNVSSVSGRIVSARSAVYSATKFAVNAFSEGLRQELYKDRIRVIVIEPGAVATELTNHIPDPKLKETVKSWVAGMTALQSADIANAVVYALAQPWNVSVNELMIRPTEQQM